MDGLISESSLYFYYTVMIKQEWEDQDHLRAEESGDMSPLETIKYEQEDTKFVSPFQQLHSANPILPPGIHKQKPGQHSIRYKLVNDRQKLNKTTFPQVRSKNWLNKTYVGGSNRGGIAKIEEQEQEDEKVKGLREFMNNESEFRNAVEGKKLIYLRFNNIKYNRVGANQIAYFASFFLNVRKDSIIAKKTPIFQYLPKICKDISPIIPQYHSVVAFDSRFESGNLFCAFLDTSQSIATYDLYMQNDTNTKGCTQWFYFSLSSEKRIKIRIRVMNFYKPTSLYMKGMKVLVSSNDAQPNSKSEWKRVGTAIQYNRILLGNGKDTYAMEFMYQIEHPHQKYYFSYGFPYTYSHLEDFINRIHNDMPLFHRVALKTNLCKSYLGNNVYLLTISDCNRNKKNQTSNKPIIYIIGRQHPGETPASYIMEGVLRTLLSNRYQMEQLRQNFIIKVIPMVNVDGVICGNYRSNFSGNDVNRQWAFPSKKLHPQLFNLKQEIISNRRNAYFFLDIHAHSRKMNSFFYGSKPCGHQGRLFPFICSKLNKHINFQQCSFVDDPSKRTTARVVLENEASIKKSLTFEASFYGYEDEGRKIKVHFKMQDFRAIGQTLALSFFYSQIGILKKNNNQGDIKGMNETESKISSSLRLGNEKNKKKTDAQLKIQKNIMKMEQKWKKEIQRMNNEDAISEGSSLDPQHFQLKQEEQEKLQTLEQHMKNKYSDIQNNPNDKIGLEESKDVLIIQKRGKNRKRTNQFQEQKQPIRQKGLSLDQNEIQKTSNMSFFPFQSNLRNTQMVKKLENELQVQKNNRRYGSMNKDNRKVRANSNLSEFKDQCIKGERFKSIQVEPEPAPNYRNNIIQMKKALKYFMENKTYNYKSADYDDYKNFLRYSTNGPSLMLTTDRESIARIKKKYARI